MCVDDAAGNAPGCYCSPRPRMSSNSRKGGSKCVSMTRRAMRLVDIARHVIGCHLTQEIRVHSSCVDVASNIHPSLAAGRWTTNWWGCCNPMR